MPRRGAVTRLGHAFAGKLSAVRGRQREDAAGACSMTTPGASIFSLAAGFLGGWLLYLRVAARQNSGHVCLTSATVVRT